MVVRGVGVVAAGCGHGELVQVAVPSLVVGWERGVWQAGVDQPQQRAAGLGCERDSDGAAAWGDAVVAGESPGEGHLAWRVDGEVFAEDGRGVVDDAPVGPAWARVERRSPSEPEGDLTLPGPFPPGGVVGVLEQAGYRIVRTQNEVRARLASNDELRAFGADPELAPRAGRIVIEMTHATYGEQGEPLEAVVSVRPAPTT